MAVDITITTLAATIDEAVDQALAEARSLLREVEVKSLVVEQRAGRVMAGKQWLHNPHSARLVAVPKRPETTP